MISLIPALRRPDWTVLLCLALLLGAATNQAADGFLQIRDRYFWDPAASNYFIARGVAYQTWNPPVGANQSLAQIDYDLLEFKKMHANSVRCEFVWSQLETQEGEYDWRKPDHLVAQAQQLGLKLFVIIGFQYPPAWFPKQWRGVNDRVLTSNAESNYLSDVLNYEHPEARRVYQRHIAKVTDRYKNSPAIGAWILGNEYAYFDLWEDPHLYPTRRFLGYDPQSQASFRRYLLSIYQGDIAALNTNWETQYPDFDSVVMPGKFPPDYHNGAYQDLIQWRKLSIGDFIGLGAQTAKATDPHHLITYSMVGGIFNGNDANYTCEDGRTIVARCRAGGAPLDFWSINNYAWASFGSELRSADYGVGKYQAQTQLPIMISETGHSSTEDLLGPGAAERQAKALPSTLWESLSSGAIGVHFFHWNDRNNFTPDYFYRERGFGIVEQTRKTKQPVYDNMLNMFRWMQTIGIDNLLGGSVNPPADIQFLWSTNADMTWPRANQENCMIWGALKRLGYQPAILDDEQFERGDYTNAPVLLLSRCQQMSPNHLERVANRVIPAGIHVHANADLPGQVDAYQHKNTGWTSLMSSLFGLRVANASVGFETSPTNALPAYAGISFKGAGNMGAFTPAYGDSVLTWKIWHGLQANSGSTIVTHRGSDNTQPALPALQIKNLGLAKTAINTFALGDIFGSSSPTHLWDLRYGWLRSVYRNWFGLVPAIDLTGSGAQHIMPDYRICRNGSVLISLLNEDTNIAEVTVTAPRLLTGRRVENLTAGGILSNRSDGEIILTLAGDDYVLLYAYNSNGVADESLVSANPNKIWFESAPQAVWPNGSPYAVQVGYDTAAADLKLFASIEQVRPAHKLYGQSLPVAATGMGRSTVPVPVLDADANDPNYISSPEGAEYVFHAWFEQSGRRVNEAFLPVRLLWGVRPATPLPAAIVPGHSYPVAVEWQELPSYEPEDPTPLDRARLWDSLAATKQHYQVRLQLWGASNQLLASDSVLTRHGTGSNLFTVWVPSNAAGPFTWSASLQTATNVLSHDVEDSFEGRDRGANWVFDRTPQYIDLQLTAPWTSYSWPPDSAIKQNEGVQLEGSNGSQSAFVVVMSPANLNVAVFGLSLVFPNGDWALPADSSQWTNYLYSFDFKEKNAYDCSLELQVKNDDPEGTGKWIQYSKHYTPGPDGWDTVRATLADFGPPPGLWGVFDPEAVHALVLNILIMTPGVQYVGSFDNIQFLGPEINADGGVQTGLYLSANDVLGVLRIRPMNSRVEVSWTGSGVLQTANQVQGPWTDAPQLTNPQTLAPAEFSRFFRLRQ